MAVTLKGQSAIYEGASTDTKPTDVDNNTIFKELDTGINYYYDGTDWNEIPKAGGFTPTESQLTAMNSGITAEDVEQITTNKNNISSANIILTDMIDTDCKNRLLFDGLATANAAGVIYTINSDGSITADVSAQTDNSYVTLRYSGTNVKIDEFCNGNYYLSGCPANGQVNGYRMYAARSTYQMYDYGNGVLLENTDITNIIITIYIESTYSGGNLTFKPMICRKEEYQLSNKYVGYAPSNRELYEIIKALQA